MMINQLNIETSLVNIINDKSNISLEKLEIQLKLLFHKSNYRNSQNFFIVSSYIEFLINLLEISSNTSALVLNPDIGFFTRYLFEKTSISEITSISMSVPIEISIA